KGLQNQAEYELQQSSEAVRLSLQALADKLRTLPGRKSVFWITEGFPPRQLRAMDAAWSKTISALNDANVEVNTVDEDGLGGPARYWGPGGIISMQQVAEQTGGRPFFHTNDLAGAMAGGIADDRSSYTLAFYLTDVDNKYHDLKVKVDRPGVQLNYRQGYFARSEADADLDTRKSDLVAVLTNPVSATGVGITATIDLKPGTPRGTLAAHVKLDPDALTVTRVKNEWTCKVEEVFLELNAKGAELAKFSMEQPFSVTDAQKPGFDAHGASLTQTIPLIAGAAKLQIAVRDAASGHTGSLSIDLTQVMPH
ncbi:MAG TPA: VWA domain-containing protein, partial [Bryobacteraceae bacterium]